MQSKENKGYMNDTSVEAVAMTGTGLSKLFDIQHNQFQIVYCNQCGY